MTQRKSIRAAGDPISLSREKSISKPIVKGNVRERKGEYSSGYWLEDSEIKFMVLALLSFAAGLIIPQILTIQLDVKEFVRLSEEDDWFPTPLASPTFGSCAMVGAAGHLLGSGAGPEIDTHQAVWRVNTHAIHGFQSDVGSKTTFRVLDYQTETAKMQELSVAKSEKDTKWLFYMPTHEKRDKAIEFVKSTFGEQGTDDIFLSKDTSKIEEGFIKNPDADYVALWVATRLCTSITAYGMLGDSWCRNSSVLSSTRATYDQVLPVPSFCLSRYLSSQEDRRQREQQEKAVDSWTTRHSIAFKHPDCFDRK